MKDRIRYEHGVPFVCVKPGQWHSVDERFYCYRMMEGTTHEAWEAYVGPDGLDKNDLAAQEVTLGGLLFALVKQYYH